jgi:iron complex outermembrane receptor protein
LENFRRGVHEELGVFKFETQAGWGKTGNQEIPEKQTQALFISSTASNYSYPLYTSGAYPAGTIYARLANPDLQWETSKQIDAGWILVFSRVHYPVR